MCLTCKQIRTEKWADHACKRKNILKPHKFNQNFMSIRNPEWLVFGQSSFDYQSLLDNQDEFFAHLVFLAKNSYRKAMPIQKLRIDTNANHFDYNPDKFFNIFPIPKCRTDVIKLIGELVSHIIGR